MNAWQMSLRGPVVFLTVQIAMSKRRCQRTAAPVPSKVLFGKKLPFFKKRCDRNERIDGQRCRVKSLNSTAAGRF